MKGLYILLNKKHEQVLKIRSIIQRHDILLSLRLNKINFSDVINKKINSYKNVDFVFITTYIDESFNQEKIIKGDWKSPSIDREDRISWIIFNRRDWIPLTKNQNCIEYIFQNLRKDKNNFGILETFKKDVPIKINFWSRKDSKIKNRGPIIQSQNKIHYFNRDIKDIKFFWGRRDISSIWEHFLFDRDVPLGKKNYSIGPNIFIKKGILEKHKNRPIVADSEWFRDYMIDEWGINRDNISVIPIYVSNIFYNTFPKRKKKFTVGLTGYYYKKDIKNLESLPKICKALPDINFELLSSRGKNSFPFDWPNLKNLKHFSLQNNQIPLKMKEWGMYLSISKRERGPAALQEARVVGIPTMTPNHTGYSEFNPLFPLDIEPYKKLDKRDIDQIVSGIREVKKNWLKYSRRALEEKTIFWEKKKKPALISKKWRNFFLQNLKK